MKKLNRVIKIKELLLKEKKESLFQTPLKESNEIKSTTKKKKLKTKLFQIILV